MNTGNKIKIFDAWVEGDEGGTQETYNLFFSWPKSVFLEMNIFIHLFHFL